MPGWCVNPVHSGDSSTMLAVAVANSNNVASSGKKSTEPPVKSFALFRIIRFDSHAGCCGGGG